MQKRVTQRQPALPDPADLTAAPKKPTWKEVFAALDAANFPDDFLEDRDAGLSPIPDQREDF